MKIFPIFVLINLIGLQVVHAISQEDKQNFDQILTPIAKIYDFVKYSTTLVASLFLVFAGITYMTASSNVNKKDTVKQMIAYIVIGIAIIWGAPYIVSYLLK